MFVFMKTETPQLTDLLAREQAIRRETEILRDANFALTQDLSLERVLETLLDFLSQLVPYDSANVMLLSNGDSKITVSALRGYEQFQDEKATRAITFDANTNPLLQRIFVTKQSVVIPDTHREPDWQWAKGADHVRSWLGVPLVTSGKVIGLYSVDKVTPNFFHAEHVRLAETLAARAASAIQNAQLFEQTQHYVKELEERIAERKRAEVALRESEERYRELFENAKDAIYVHDLKGNYIRVNRAAEELSGYSREEIVGHNFTEFIAKEHVSLVRQNFSELTREGEASYEADVIGKDGRRVPVEISSRAIYENGVMVGVQGMVRDITERKLAQDALQMFSRQLIEAQEDERRRISRELHDQIGQILTAVKMNLYTVQRLCILPEASSYVKDNIDAVDEALRLVRDLSVDLRPPVLDDLGLVTALRWYVDRYSKRTGLNVEVIIDLPDHNERFSRERETACFRIAQAALSNVARHAQASQVQVQLVKDENGLVLIVKDDGIGFNLKKRAPRAATLGLVSMQERAHAAGGAVEINSARSKGTEVRLTLPLEP
jgi:PAS domain S-box-containing protein